MITAAVIAKDEERHIAACLHTMSWADERLVLDSGSADRTRELALEAGARVELRAFDDFPHQRNAALALAQHDWVLFVDADERVTPELAAECQRTVVDRAEHAGYFIPRFNRIFGKVIRHAGWYPDYQMRLLDRRRARYDVRVPVHEVVQLDHGQAGYLREHFIHYNYDSVAQFLAKQRRYSALEARRLSTEGNVRYRSLLSMPVREFARRYWTLEGYRDGAHGLLLSALMAYFTFETYRQCVS
ncbi:MAG TPA: glycosyltransferase family 2 protein [Chloroflexota bacterium]|nr:glycosyltransferase family 2 protein [Chloroflexota bacterium]